MRESPSRPDGAPDALSDAVELLREEPRVRPEWRDALLRQVETSQRRPALVRRRVSATIPMAIAAGLVCALFGGGVAFVTMRPSHVAAPIAAVETSGGLTVPVRFSLVAPNATMVSIVGDFNRWNPRALPMRRSPDGRIWEIEVRLPLGRYDYAFMIDGRLSPDPAAPRDVNDDFGAPNSIVMVRGS